MVVNFDSDREKLTGIPEVILAEPKTKIDLEEVLSISLEQKECILITRISEDQIDTIRNLCVENDKNLEFDRYKRTAIIGKPNTKKYSTEVAIISGGTSDQKIVEEIAMSCKFYGITTSINADVGVAGIHRHKIVLDDISNNENIKLIIAVAGNEGALFSILSGQTDLPMIAVPTSIGYGFGGKGITALQSALQSCSPGIVTVNIDNGFGAASFAKKILSVIEHD